MVVLDGSDSESVIVEKTLSGMSSFFKPLPSVTGSRNTTLRMAWSECDVGSTHVNRTASTADVENILTQRLNVKSLP